MVSVAYPAWLLGHAPTTQIICASYGQQLADDLARDCRQVMQSDWYCRLFPAARLMPERQAISAFETCAGGQRRATSVGGVVTGFGADVIIVDDPTKPEEVYSDAERARANGWARHTLFTRLNDKANGAIILVMQRLHENDMIGHVSSFSQLKLVSFPAIAQDDEVYAIPTPFGIRHHARGAGDALHPEREPIEVLAEIREALGTRFFSAQYLQMPGPPGGSLVNPEWFMRFDPTNPPVFERIVQSWDTASKASELSSYSACTTWGQADNQLFLLHVLRKQLEYPDLKRAVLEQARLFNAKTVLIEEAAAGIALIQELKRDGFYKAEAVKPKGDKEMRLRAQTALIEAGRVFLPSSAPWLDTYLHELTMFPATLHSDQVDSTSQALAYLTEEVDGFYAMIRRDLRAMSKVPHVRFKHDDPGMTFRFITGRTPPREPDGSFLATEEEFRPIANLPGVHRIDG